MIKISILYPNTQNTRFDMDYYLNTHMPMSIERLSRSEGFQSVSVERGLHGNPPETPPAYVAMYHYVFDTFEKFLETFLPHAELLQGDIANYTDVSPVIQISEVKITR